MCGYCASRFYTNVYPKCPFCKSPNVLWLAFAAKHLDTNGVFRDVFRPEIKYSLVLIIRVFSFIWQLDTCISNNEDIIFYYRDFFIYSQACL